jgi:hypothetical protein
MPVAGKIVLITGTGRGPGFEYGRAFGTAGALVAAGDAAVVASPAATDGMPYTLHYTTSETTVIGLTHGLTASRGRLVS